MNDDTITTTTEGSIESPTKQSLVEALAALQLERESNVRLLGPVTGEEYTTGTGQRLANVHHPTQCAGRHCAIHNPSEHVMDLFPTHWRGDHGLMERICPHGIGHPDPDDLAYKLMRAEIQASQIDDEDERSRILGNARCEGIHGCDGCCISGNPLDT